jgi:hypothetical protein
MVESEWSIIIFSKCLNWINSMQVKKILFTNVFFSWSLCMLNMFPSMVFPKHLYFFFVCVLLFNCGVRCYYVGNQSCIEWFFNPLRNLLFNLKIHLLLTGFFFFFYLFLDLLSKEQLRERNGKKKHKKMFLVCFMMTLNW